MKPNELTGAIIGAAIEVHRELGPGKPESAYEAALAHEFALRGLPHQTQKPVPVVYKGIKLDCGYRLDALVDNRVVVEAKAVECMHPVHRAQGLTYLKLGGWKLALLINFNVALLKEGVERLVLGSLDECGGGNLRADTLSAEPGRDITLATESSESNSGDFDAEQLAAQVIAAAIEVHRALGPGLLPSSYEACLCHELSLRGVAFERRRPLALSYKGNDLAASDEIELLIGGRLVVSPRALLKIETVHESQVLSQLRLGSWRLGLLLNFNSVRLAEGIRRLVWTPRGSPVASI